VLVDDHVRTDADVEVAGVVVPRVGRLSEHSRTGRGDGRPVDVCPLRGHHQQGNEIATSSAERRAPA
jgi:hypothetical protein